jgi:hypothetical protein
VPLRLNDIFSSRMDFEKNILELDVDYPEIIMNFECEINGQLLVLPVQGEGPGRINLSKIFNLFQSHF